MRKPGDDLKISISELFGGDLPDPSDILDDVEEPSPSQSASPSSIEAEGQFQEEIIIRNRELEMKTQELERRLQEMQAQLPKAGDVADSISAQELQSVPMIPEPSEVPTADSPIDFNAPIALPFIGPAQTPAIEPLSPAAEEPGVQSHPDQQKAEDINKLQAEHEFLMLYDEFRDIIAHELRDLVGEKKTYTMLARTVELARGKYPEVFRNANWDKDGNLLENGSVDSHRILENKNAMDPQKADAVIDAALSALINLRLQAVEKGLGTGLKNKVRARLIQWLNEKTKKTVQEGKDTSYLKRLNNYLA